jgi:hypothetical protein
MDPRDRGVELCEGGALKNLRSTIPSGVFRLLGQSALVYWWQWSVEGFHEFHQVSLVLGG